MTALVRYTLRDFVRSHRFLPPLIVFGGVLLTLYAVHPTPVLSSYGATAICMYPIAAWYTTALFGAEDPVQRQITIVNSGSATRVYLAKALTVILLLIPLVLVALLGPALLGYLAIPDGQSLLPYLGLGLLAHVAAAVPGVAIGLLWSPPVVQRTGYTLGGVLVCLLATIPANRLAPPLTATRAMRDGTAPVTVAAHLLPSLVGAVVIAVAAALVYLGLARQRS